VSRCPVRSNADGTDVSVGVTENSLITAYDADTTNGQAVIKITGDAYATPVSRPPVHSSDLSVFQPDFSKFQTEFRCCSIRLKQKYLFSDVFFSNLANKLLAFESWQQHPVDSRISVR